MKTVRFLGDFLKTIKSFPVGVRREVGFQIERLQRGLNPDDWKPMKAIGKGVREIRVRDAVGVFRVIYAATESSSVCVVHAFQKKTQATSKRDLETARMRLGDLTRESRK